jgi:hypothetical protein
MSIPLDCWLGSFDTHFDVRVMLVVEDPTVTEDNSNNTAVPLLSFMSM